jgi:hypothetical protein
VAFLALHHNLPDIASGFIAIVVRPFSHARAGVGGVESSKAQGRAGDLARAPCVRQWCGSLIRRRGRTTRAKSNRRCPRSARGDSGCVHFGAIQRTKKRCIDSEAPAARQETTRSPLTCSCASYASRTDRPLSQNYEQGAYQQDSPAHVVQPRIHRLTTSRSRHHGDVIGQFLAQFGRHPT